MKLNKNKLFAISNGVGYIIAMLTAIYGQEVGLWSSVDTYKIGLLLGACNLIFHLLLSPLFVEKNNKVDEK